MHTNVHLNCLSLLGPSLLYSVIVFVLFSQFTMWYLSHFFFHIAHTHNLQLDCGIFYFYTVYGEVHALQIWWPPVAVLGLPSSSSCQSRPMFHKTPCRLLLFSWFCFSVGLGMALWLVACLIALWRTALPSAHMPFSNPSIKTNNPCFRPTECEIWDSCFINSNLQIPKRK